MEAEEEIITRRGDSDVDTPVKTISILVVDDDATCLSIVAAILKRWKYEVVTVKHPIDALYTLRIKGGAFDLVVSDVYMPDMNGFELQRLIDEEFKLPVVLMSADDKEGVIMKGLQSGAAFFIVKPISPDDLRDLWQYAAINQRGKSIVIEETVSIAEKTLVAKGANEDMESAASSTFHHGHVKKERSRTKLLIKDSNENGMGNVNSVAPKKTKVIWTNALHNRFLEAIRSIGLDRAVPKKILELMNVPELTRENVASHLQKYRIFLKRVSEASCKIQSAADKDVFENNTSSSGYPSMMSNKFQRVCQQNPEQLSMIRSTFQQELRKHVLSVNASKFGGDSCNNYSTQSSYGQTHPRFNFGSFKKPLLVDASSSEYKPELPSFEVDSSYRQIWSGLVSRTNSTQVYQPSTEAIPRRLTYDQPNYNPNTQENMKAFDNHSFSRNLNYNTCFTGCPTEQLDGLGNMEDQFLETPSGLFNSNLCSTNIIPNVELASETVFRDNNAMHMAPSAALTSDILLENPCVLQLPPQQTSLENGDGNGNRSGLAENNVVSASIAYQVPFVNGDLSCDFSNQINGQSANDQDGGRALVVSNGNNTYHFRDSFLGTCGSNQSPRPFNCDEFLESVFANSPCGVGLDNLGDF